jgi:hypothetical protein
MTPMGHILVVCDALFEKLFPAQICTFQKTAVLSPETSAHKLAPIGTNSDSVLTTRAKHTFQS